MEGSFHSAELWYMHGTLDRCWRKKSDWDYRLSDAMLDYWTNFAKTGDPNGKDLTEWTPYTVDNPKTMVLGDSIAMSDLADWPGARVANK